MEAWLASPRSSWRWVSRALEDRLESYRVENELAAERDWALEVLRILEEQRDNQTGFARLRLQRMIPTKLRQLQIDEESLVPADEVEVSINGE